MINAIIFSKDRAQQLRLLLESIEKNAKDIFEINIIYLSSNSKFEQGYDKLKKENLISDINWIEEKGLKNNIIDSISKNNKHTCFFADDNVFYFPIKEEDIINSMDDPEVFCFSLRLGLNTTFCHSLNTENNLYGIKKIGNDFIKWNWTKLYLDYGYPLSLDGHIFRTKEILKMIKKVGCYNPNHIEENLQIFDNYPKELMAAYAHSTTVNSPNNVVNETHANKRGEVFGYTAKGLNDKYLDGWIIDYNLIDFSDIKGCYQELEFKFKEL